VASACGPPDGAGQLLVDDGAVSSVVRSAARPSMRKFFVTMLRRLERSINTRQAYKFFLRDWLSLTDLQSCAQAVSTMRFTRTLEPLEMSSPRGKRITVIAPHPDDEMLGAGGTLVRALKSGASVRCIYLTSSKPPTEVEAETTEVAQRIGYRTEFLRYPVHAIPLSDESVARLGEALSAQPMDCLFVPILFDDHDDHRRANQLMWHAWCRGLIRDDIEVWCYQVYSPIMANVVVDISDVAEEKAAAVRMWKSQMQHRNFDHYILGLNAFNIRLLPKARYVEAFFVVPIRDYSELCQTYFKNPDAAFYNPAYKSGAMANPLTGSTI
jgi:N-acetylglucosamine malate deacetylase 1